MYFKVVKGTETFDKLEAIYKKVVICNNMAKDLVEELGFELFARSNWHVAGGISCIQSDVKPKGYKLARTGEKKLFYPNAKNVEVLEKFKALPVVEFKEYNDTIGYKEQYYTAEKRGMVHSRMFGSQKLDGVYLIEIANEAEYTPKADMVEILASEYITLTKNK